MTWRAATDLITNLQNGTNGIDMANVTGLSNLPLIHIAGSTDTSGDSVSGELVLLRELFRKQDVNQYFRHEFYTIPATFYFHGSSETTFKELIEEIDLVLRTYSKDQTHEYTYEMEYDWDTNLSESVAKITFVLTKSFVAL